jgi:hypothetical protein
MTKYLNTRPGSIEEITKQLMDDYQAFFKKELEKSGKSIPSMTNSEKKAFFDKVAKDWNKEKDEDVEKAPHGHELRPGKLLLEPKKDDMKKQPNMQQEATSSIIGQDLEKPVEDEAVEPNKMLVIKPNKKNEKGEKEGVKKIDKKDWSTHQKQGYIQAEEVVLEAIDLKLLKSGNYITVKSKEYVIDNVKGDNVKASDKNGKFHDFKIKDIEKIESSYSFKEAVKNPYAVGMAAAEKSTGDKPPLKKSTITKAHDIAKKIEKNEELTAGQKKLPMALQKAILKKQKNEDIQADKENASQKVKGGEKEIINKLKQEEVKIDEAEMKAIDTDKAEMERLHARLTQLRDAEKALVGGDKTNLLKQINQTRLSLLDLQKKNLENKVKTEDVQADKINADQKSKGGEKDFIKNLWVNSVKENTIKEAEDKKVDVKKDKKGEKDVNVQIEVESKKPNYKSYKKSLKKEQDEPKNGKTMTGKKMTPIDTEPKISHN